MERGKEGDGQRKREWEGVMTAGRRREVGGWKEGVRERDRER